MEREKIHSIKLGLMISAGLLLFILAIYYLGSQQNLFSSTITLKSYFKDVNGLVVGNKVRYSGITVGTVSRIQIIKDTTVLVELAVDKKLEEFIREDSKVEIISDGIMGSKFINILPGTTSADVVADDDILQTQEAVDLRDILEDSRKLITEGRQITKNLLIISEKMNQGEGDFAVLLNENTITSKLGETGDELLKFATSAKNISTSIENGNGDLGRLLKDTIITTQITEVMQRLDSVALKTDSLTTHLLSFSKQLNSGNGIVNRLVYDTVMANNIDTTVIRVNNSIDDIQDAANTLENSWIFNLFSKDKKRREKK